MLWLHIWFLISLIVVYVYGEIKSNRFNKCWTFIGSIMQWYENSILKIVA